MTVSIDLAWTDNATDEDNYIVERREVEKVAVLPGAATDHFSSPHAANQVPAGAFSLVWYGSVDNLSGNSFVFGKWGLTASTSNKCYGIQVINTGALQFLMSDNGTTTRSAVTTATIEAGQRIGYRADYVPGAGLTHYFDHGSGWVSTPGQDLDFGPCFASTAQLSLGRIYLDTNIHAGTTELAQVWDGAYGTGTLLAEFIPTHAPGYGTAQSWDSVNTGETWTGQGNASIDAVNTALLDNFVGVNGTLLPAHTPDINPAGNPWVTSSGVDDFEINNNQMFRPTSATARHRIDIGETDVHVVVDITGSWTEFSNRVNPRLGVRMPNNDELEGFFLAVLPSGLTYPDYQFKIEERTSTGSVDRANAGTVDALWPDGTVKKWRYSVEGTTHAVWSEDGFSLTYTGASAELDNNTRVGMQDNSVGSPPSQGRWDNLKVTTIAAADNDAGWEVLTDTLPADTEVYEDFTALSGKRYAYRTACKNATGQSGYSNVIEVNT